MTISREPVSQNKDWNTPQEYIDRVRQVFRGAIHLDPCSNEYSLVNAHTEYKLPHHDGLKESWNYPTIYVNPPYGRDKARKTTIKDWLLKCSEANRDHKSQVIALVPVATNTKHWQENVFKTSAALCFLKVPRLKFMHEGKVMEKGAPMACAMIYWGTDRWGFCFRFRDLGKCLYLNCC